MAKEILHTLEVARDSRSLSLSEEWLRRRLKHHILALASLERTVARLRSGLLWLKEGDANSSYFHQHARYKKKKNFMAALNRILHGDVSNLHLLNSAYVTLLPEKVEALEVKDFRPISLIHSFAKIVTKIMATRLAPKLPELVSKNQSAFVKGRSIQD